MTVSLDDLETLFNLQARARVASGLNALGFIAVNETCGLLRYRQAVMWNEAGEPAAVSGVAEPEPNAPFVLWLKGLYKTLGKAPSGRISPDTLDEKQAVAWTDWFPRHGYWVAFGSPGKGGVLYVRTEPWTDEDARLLHGVAETYGDVLHTFSARTKRRSVLLRWNRRKAVVLFSVLALLATGFVQVPLTVLAPAEVVAANPESVRAPLEGVISRMHVQPNQQIRPGQPLFDLDPVGHEKTLEVAEKAMAAARAEYEQSAQKALFDPAEKARLLLLEGRIRERETEVAYLKTILKRVQVRASRSGVAIVDEPDEWIGRPVAVGEHVLAVSDERDTEVEAWLAVGDAVALQPGAPVTMFLNSAPFKPVVSSLLYMGFRAQPRPDGTLAYRVRATISDNEERPRLGLRGTVRIEAGRAALLYWLLRRPLAQIRQILGI